MGTVETVDLTGLAAEECARVDAELDVAPQTDGNVRGVPRLLRRAIRNLLENARRYGAGAIDVTLDTRRPPGAARASTTAAPACRPRCASASSSRSTGCPAPASAKAASGSGLALVKSIASATAASVRCEAREGGGASFVIALPAAAGVQDGHPLDGCLLQRALMTARRRPCAGRLLESPPC